MKPANALALALLILSSCGPAVSAESARVEILTAPDGARCYAIIQGDEVKGGSCAQ